MRISGTPAASATALSTGAVVVRGRPVAADGIAVAEQVRGPGWLRRCPSAPLLLGELRRHGLIAELVRLHAPGVAPEPGELRCDVESAELFRSAGEPATAFVSCSDSLLWLSGNRPANAERSEAMSLALSAWAAAAGPRRILLAGPRSFCAGVERAIEIVERALDRWGSPLYVRKQIVHNVHVVRELAQRGVVFVDELAEVPHGSTVVFSAHGVSPAVRAEADSRGLRVVDATCPLVAKVHGEARRFVRRGDTVVLIGHAGHEESEGTLGEAPERMVLVQNEDDVAGLEIAGPVSYLTQTTLAVDEVRGVLDALRDRFPQLTGPNSDDICYATSNRQDALKAVAVDADLVLVVGSANSSNSTRLVELARRQGTPAHLVDDVTGIDLSWLAGAGTIGLTAGASAPPALVAGVLDAIGGLGATRVLERQVAQETIHFGLPSEVREGVQP